jgi:hypothetical protein
MEALMAADLAMGGTNKERIERLLAAGSSLDVMQFFHQDALQRVSAQPTTVEHHIHIERPVDSSVRGLCPHQRSSAGR